MCVCVNFTHYEGHGKLMCEVAQWDFRAAEAMMGYVHVMMCMS